METATVDESREATEAATGSKTVADLFPLAIQKHGPQRAVIYRDEETGEWAEKTYAEVARSSRPLPRADRPRDRAGRQGLDPRQHPPEWSYFDFAALTAGATVVPIYQTNSPEECQYVLENSDARSSIVEDDEQLEKIRAVRDKLPKLEHVMRMTGASDDTISMEELTERGA